MLANGIHENNILLLLRIPLQRDVVENMFNTGAGVVSGEILRLESPRLAFTMAAEKVY